MEHYMMCEDHPERLATHTFYGGVAMLCEECVDSLEHMPEGKAIARLPSPVAPDADGRG